MHHGHGTGENILLTSLKGGERRRQQAEARSQSPSGAASVFLLP